MNKTSADTLFYNSMNIGIFNYPSNRVVDFKTELRPKPFKLFVVERNSVI